ncbi:lysophospholipid acyltransferase family protein [Tenggerimyces flavus]|uniref:Lysophospholipid acyltransferase family protein n=1 Tax=Tenggerimyces flavus TaxID=1708749 RepID=A0ABV7Y3U6_9ACTN|nr:lysophospholipid acyltransferase family protein [Tenggerimyces flavus]MBM7788498.1 1-acyl-sn-glycerol-3-phosphate acyltransferase [Tenggerimyces flavus]
MTAFVVPPYWSGADGPPRRGARVLRPLATALVRAMWDVRVYDRHHVPTGGPVILAANHTGFLDGPLVYAVAARPVHALIKREMFRGAVGSVLRKVGQISVDRSVVDAGAVKSMLAVLDRGDTLAIYPEGTRGAGDFAEIKSGVAYLGLCTGAPIVPVAILGTRVPGRSVGSIPSVRSRLDVVFGPALSIDPVPWPRRRHVVREHAMAVRTKLVEHLRHACALTGRSLPGPVASPELEPGPVVTREGEKS